MKVGDRVIYSRAQDGNKYKGRVIPDNQIQIPMGKDWVAVLFDCDWNGEKSSFYINIRDLSKYSDYLTPIEENYNI